MKGKCSGECNTAQTPFWKRSHLSRLAIPSLHAQACTGLTPTTFCIEKVLLNTNPSRAGPLPCQAGIMGTAESGSLFKHQHIWRFNTLGRCAQWRDRPRTTLNQHTEGRIRAKRISVTTFPWHKRSPPYPPAFQSCSFFSWNFTNALQSSFPAFTNRRYLHFMCRDCRQTQAKHWSLLW